ncbi:SET and MYND domain-containing protein 4 [Chionoecetes opilio]|uniref:SET and MYND domain-containing protein 4 n=1 Tax=Chionoecetes opilio TaxID=41210 RepID=A0A8J4Y303_CHIOP|nr:SET and MYND domain-containing protein 4 [Chionoecetes opilio]
MASFKELYAKFRGLLLESWLTNDVAAHFGPAATLDGMFKYLWSQAEAQQQLEPPPGNHRISRKGASEAEKFRNEGNRFYREKKLEQALLAYNYSILAAPHPGLDRQAHETQHEGLPLALANRSAVLYEMGQYKEALADAERALTLGYPPSKRHRLQERKAKCLQAMGKMEEANAVLDETIDALAAMSLDEKEITAVKNNITKLKSTCDNKQKMTPASPRYQHVFYKGPARPPAVSQPNPDLPCLSDGVSIQYTPIRGRHLVAGRDILPGEVLVQEDAIAATVKLDATLRSHCSTCLHRCRTPLPCPSCSLVVFCSEECQRSGVSGYHGAECGALPALVSLQLDPAAALAFRVLSSTTLPALRSKVSALLEEGGGSRPVLNVQTDYRALYHLEGHATARTETQLQETAAIACILTRILFENCPSFSMHDTGQTLIAEDDIILVGGQLMRLILGLECNIHHTKEAEVGTNGVNKPTGLEVGWSVYSALSFVNHSCVANTQSSSHGKVKFLYSVNAIPRGAEITDSYGVQYVSHTRAQRRTALQQHYYFCCGCAACQADWPLFTDIRESPSLRCPSCFQALTGITCILCDLTCTSQATTKTGIQLYDASTVQSQLNKAWRDFLKAATQIQKGRVSRELVDMVKKLLGILDRYTVYPSQTYIKAQEVLTACFHLMGSVRYLPLTAKQN